MNKLKKALSKVAIVAVCTTHAIFAYSDYVVIVKAGTKVKMQKKDVESIFLGKNKNLKEGLKAIPYNLNLTDPARKAFQAKILEKTPDQERAYWSRLIFTGKAVPIPELSSEAEMVEKVGATAGAIGYVDEKAINDSVRVVLKY